MKYAFEEVRGKYIIRLELLPEYDMPDWDFESEEERQELLRKIDQGVYLWFCAKVSAWIDGVELASDYLGGCCYDSVAQFVEDSGYYEDMVETVITEADEFLAKHGGK